MPERKDIAPADMTDAQLIEAVAVEVMGWNEQIPPSSATEQAAWWHDAQNKPVIRQLLWNPLTDWNHTMEVSEKAKLAFSIWYATSGARNFSTIGRYWDDSVPLQRAICLAALQAVRH